MARQVRRSFALLIWVAALASFAVAQPQPARTEQSVVLALPAGVELPPGSHKAVIDVAGKSVPAEVLVPSARPAGGSAGAPASAQWGGESAVAPGTSPPSGGLQSSSPPWPAWTPIAMAALLPIILIAAGAWVYFKKIQPRKHVEPYRRALELMKDKQYEEALPLLTEIESKLPGALRRDARFFIAFANAQLDNIPEAEHILAALHREDPRDSNTAYLLAYIRVREKNYDAAEPVLEGMESNGNLGLLQAKRLLGIVKFSRALVALKENRVDAAAELFEKVQALGDFDALIPADLRNRHIVVGTQALFAKDLPAARKQFESLRDAVASIPGHQRELLLAKSKLGLALASWIEDAPDGYSALEGLLVEAARLFDPQTPLELPWPEEAEAKDVVEKLKDVDAKKELPKEKAGVNHCLRDVHFLRGIAVLRNWAHMEGEAAHRAMVEQYKACLARFACARARDEEFGDVLLVVGLLMYYLHEQSRPERTRGVDLLQEAQKLGMRDPNALEIINNRDRIEKATADAVDKYMHVLDKYLKDDTVRKEVRQALLERLSRYRRFPLTGKPPDLTRARSVPPTVDEVRARSEILHVRINELFQSRADSERMARLRSLTETLRQDTQRLHDQAQAIEQSESELLALTGDQLFGDQEGA